MIDLICLYYQLAPNYLPTCLHHYHCQLTYMTPLTIQHKVNQLDTVVLFQLALTLAHTTPPIIPYKVSEV